MQYRTAERTLEKGGRRDKGRRRKQRREEEDGHLRLEGRKEGRSMHCIYFRKEGTMGSAAVAVVGAIQSVKDPSSSSLLLPSNK